MLVRFAESDPRIEADAFAFDSGPHQVITATAEVAVHLRDDVLISWTPLHRLGRALHVHHTHAGPSGRDQVDHPRLAFESAHVIDDFYSRTDRRLGHARLPRVDRDRDIDLVD